jgi:antitoxin component YwqK of YwqJK toxin-antitoxin module
LSALDDRDVFRHAHASGQVIDKGEEEIKMKTTQHNKKDKKTGLQKEYFRDGKLASAGKYLDGKKTGVWKTYDTDENLSKTTNHKPK